MFQNKTDNLAVVNKHPVKSLQHYETMLDRISDGLLSLDTDLRYTFANKRIGEITGKDPESLIGRYIWDVFPEVVNSATYHAIQRAIAEQKYCCITDYFAPLDLWQENHIYPTSTGLSIFVRDVSEQKRSELELIAECKIAEAKVFERETSFAKLYKNLMHGFAYYQAIYEGEKIIDYRYIFTNKVYEEITGLANVAGKKISEALPGLRESDPTIFERLDRIVTDGKPESFEVFVEPLNKWFFASLYRPQPGFIVSLVDNISEQKLAENKIKQSEEDLRTIFENTTQGLILMEPDGTIKAFNEKALDYGFSAYGRRMQTGKLIFDFIEKRRVNFFKSVISKVLGGETIQYNRQYKKDSEDSVWLDFSISPVITAGKITGVCISGSDITEKKRREREREFDKMNLESLINNTDDLMWSLDRNFRLISFNRPFQETMKSITGIVVLKDTDLMSESFDEKIRHRYRHLYERAFAGEAFTEIVAGEKNHTTWAEVSFYPIYSGAEVIGTACFLRDITARKNSEAQLQKNTHERELFINELSQNNKDLQQFAYITSHNLRGPVASLLGLSNLLSGYDIKDQTLKQILASMQKATHMFDETLKDLNTILTVKDHVNIKSETLLFATSFEKTLEQCSALIQECGAHITYDFNAAPGINFNKPYLESIFLNLMTNALKYKDHVRTLVVHVATKTVKNNLVLTFTDNGIGMDTKLHKDKLFKLYQRFHINVEGKGLGLFLIKSQLETFGATIDIRSEINKGTSFILTFPKIQSPVL